MSISAVCVECPPKTEYQTGQLIGGKYRLSRLIGEGAMGAVWVAVNVVLESKVAIKLLNPELRSPALVECFLREARSAAMLDHAAIVRVFDLGATDSGDPFIVMELLAGQALSALLDRGATLAPERAVQVLLPIAGAIHLAHQSGIVHRDLKPDNIMLAELYGGHLQPKVVDFGIAKLDGGATSGAINGATVVGTPDYMSPEQARGLDVVDHRSDIWSLAAVLYEALAGRAPFARSSAQETLDAVVREPAPPLSASVGGELWAIVERGLRKAPDERWPTMRAFGDALAEWLESRQVHEDCTGVSLRTHWLTASAPASASTGGRHVAPPSREASETMAVASERRALRMRVGRGAIAGIAAATALLMLLGASAVRSRAPRAAAPPVYEDLVATSDAPVVAAAKVDPVVAAPPEAPVTVLTAAPLASAAPRSASSPRPKVVVGVLPRTGASQGSAPEADAGDSPKATDEQPPFEASLPLGNDHTPAAGDDASGDAGVPRRWPTPAIRSL